MYLALLRHLVKAPQLAVKSEKSLCLCRQRVSIRVHLFRVFALSGSTSGKFAAKFHRTTRRNLIFGRSYEHSLLRNGHASLPSYYLR
jgi:hypothetical protein